ncbi:Lsr2 family protein (plasmid) [Streptomyces phaeochromogenes]|uniref:histone-like nucleoid-structuring protein Lsr2 n=1 Tax=Streptomyces phaeochromogenes TaxID=1923 RepID=UPI002F918819|nr:Lsr2 family protein [Streptomyces phaeochromogenes]
MAEKVILVDDLDETSTEGVTRIEFSWGGVDYEVDLSPTHESEYGDLLAPLLKVARVKQGAGRKARRSVKSKSETAAETKKIRDWAKAHGHDVPGRGPVPAEVREAYARAQTEPGPSVPPQGAQEEAAEPASQNPYAGR